MLDVYSSIIVVWSPQYVSEISALEQFRDNSLSVYHFYRVLQTTVIVLWNSVYKHLRMDLVKSYKIIFGITCLETSHFCL